MMTILAAVAGLVLILIILFDAFETVILPRRVTRRVRLTALYYRATWAALVGLGATDAAQQKT